MSRRVVITGIGVIAPNGIGKDAFWKALHKGESGIKPITLFNPGFYKAKQAGEVSDFKPEQFLGAKGLRNLDRATTLLCSAAKLALDDSRLEITDENCDDIGVVTGTTLSFSSIAEMSREIIEDGPQFTTAGIFAGTTINSASSQISIRHNIKGFNTTVSTGYTASLDALKYAVNFIKLNRAKAVLVAGVEGLTFASFTGFYKIGFLAGINGEEICCPFDNRRNGIILSEAAVVLLVEEEEHARARRAEIYAQIASVENLFYAYRANKYDPKARGIQMTMRKALKSAGLHEEDIDYIASSANSVIRQDALESMAVREVFNVYTGQIPVSAVKSMVGESVSAGGCLQIAAAVGSLQKSFIPPTINYKVKDPACGLDYVPNEARKTDVRNILVNNFGPGGNNASAVITRY